MASRAEDLSDDLGPFDVVTIGRALRWMTPAPTLALLDRLVRPKGSVVVCGASPVERPPNPWQARYDEFRFRVTPEKGRRKYGVEAAAFFAGSAFALKKTGSGTRSPWTL